jgi:hypothetical protein
MIQACSKPLVLGLAIGGSILEADLGIANSSRRQREERRMVLYYKAEEKVNYFVHQTADDRHVHHPNLMVRAVPSVLTRSVEFHGLARGYLLSTARGKRDAHGVHPNPEPLV